MISRTINFSLLFTVTSCVILLGCRTTHYQFENPEPVLYSSICLQRDLWLHNDGTYTLIMKCDTGSAILIDTIRDTWSVSGDTIRLKQPCIDGACQQQLLKQRRKLYWMSGPTQIHPVSGDTVWIGYQVDIGLFYRKRCW